jgi:hypothetical protein
VGGVEPLTTPSEPAPDPGAGSSASWAELERVGRRDGYAHCRCPSCGFDQMASVYGALTAKGEPKSKGGWPKCYNCHESRVIPVGDISAIRRRRPGAARTARQLADDNACSDNYGAVD